MKTNNKIFLKASCTLPLLFSLFACGNKPVEKVKININTYDGVITEEVNKGSEYVLEQKNDFDHLHVCYEVDGVNYAIGDKIKIDKEMTLTCKYISCLQENYAVLDNESSTSADLIYTSELNVTEYKKYESVLGELGTIYLPTEAIGKLDFTKENYPSAIEKTIAVDTTKTSQTIETTIPNISDANFNLKYAVRTFIKTKGANPTRIYLNYMPYYNAVSVKEEAQRELLTSPTDVTLNAIAQSSLNVTLSEGSPTVIEAENIDQNQKIISSISNARLRDGRISFVANVDGTKFSSMINNAFGSITFNRVRVTQFNQTYDSQNKKVTISFDMPEKTTTLITDNFYEGDYLEDESILLIAETDSNGKIISNPKAKLLFTPKDIISIKWYYHTSRSKQANPTVNLTEGVDYEVKNGYIVAKGTISGGKFTPAHISDLPYVLDKQLTGEINSWPGMGNPGLIKNKTNDKWFIPFTEGVEIVQLQLSVSYTHKTNEWKGLKQEYLGNYSMKKIVDKLKEGDEEVNVTFIGASNSTGANTSGYLKIYPFMDTWMQQVTDNLSSYYNVKINYENRASGGTTARDAVYGGRGWINNGQEIIQPPLDYMLGLRSEFDPTQLKAQFPTATYLGDRLTNVPDLVFVEYGINDPSYYSLNDYKTYMNQVLSWIYQKNPNACVLVFTGMYVNPISANHTFEEECHKAAMEMQKTYPALGQIHLCDMVHSMVDTGKNYTSMGSNNINHFNDFITRVAASMCLSALIDR